jgi:2-polyprenyl-3-methyl-5-hydroxy-6-metoxy-1,4-benzoquinol methylase
MSMLSTPESDFQKRSGRVHGAAEYKSLVTAEGEMDGVIQHTSALIGRLRAVLELRPGAQILELGAGCGQQLIQLTVSGYLAVGLELSPEAIATATKLAGRRGVSLRLIQSDVRHIPLREGSFDIVLAKSVLEHVPGVESVFREACRVLRVGGGFWFSTASAMCPRQNEIRGCPFFGWYPENLKQRIMRWALRERPDLIGNTRSPAVNWFTDRRARKLLFAAGFTHVLDRWDLRQSAEGGRAYRLLLRAARRYRVMRGIANACIPECAYLAIK